MLPHPWNGIMESFIIATSYGDNKLGLPFLASQVVFKMSILIKFVFVLISRHWYIVSYVVWKLKKKKMVIFKAKMKDV